MIEALIDAVIALDLNPGTKNPLLDKLDGALKKLEDDNEANDAAAISILGDFPSIVEAKRGNTIADDDADSLIAAAEQIIALLEAA